jgi:integrase
MAQRRRGQGEGSIYKRADGHWTGAVQVGVDENGKRRRRTVYGRTRAEVIAKLDKLRARVAEGGVADPGRLTVGGFFAQWLRDTARLRLRPSTHSLYSDLVRLHIGPRLGGVLLKALQPAHLTALLSAMERDSKTPRLRQMVYAVLHTALRDAVKTKLLARNPAAAVDRPRVPRKEIRALDLAEVRKLLDAAQGDPLEALYVLAVASGPATGSLVLLGLAVLGGAGTARRRTRRT